MGKLCAAEKIPSWREIEEIWYPKHLSLEQCSSEITARYKARLFQGDSLTDLTGGFGIDCSFLATGFKSATYVERQEDTIYGGHCMQIGYSILISYVYMV